MSTILFLLRADKSAACNLVVAKLCLLPSVWIVWSWIIAVGTLWAATSSDPCPASCRSRVLMMRCICPGTGTWTQQQQLCEYVGRMVQSCSIASVSRSAPINCDITERAFGICRPEISTRALVNVTGGGGPLSNYDPSWLPYKCPAITIQLVFPIFFSVAGIFQPMNLSIQSKAARGRSYITYSATKILIDLSFWSGSEMVLRLIRRHIQWILNVISALGFRFTMEWQGMEFRDSNQSISCAKWKITTRCSCNAFFLIHYYARRGNSLAIDNNLIIGIQLYPVEDSVAGDAFVMSIGLPFDFL